jgi:formamidopyrimidine-DNA glycosylase
LIISKVIYNDPRRFGFFQIIENNRDLKKRFIHLGPEPFDNKFNLKYFQKFIQNKLKTIKDLLIDQKFVSGIGNIYASEILFFK